MLFKKSKLIIFAAIFVFNCSINADIKPEIIDRVKKSVVTLYVNTSLSAYENSGKHTGTGFIIDKKQGLVLTNAHVAGGANIAHYHASFYNGKEADAKLVYYDPWLDYAFLKLDIAEIPEAVRQINFSNKNPQIGQNVFIVGNNEGQSFSIHTGTINNLYGISGKMPQHSITMSMNSRGGSSGSAVLNEQGEAVALNYGGSDTYGLALHPSYIRYALENIQKNHLPTRKHIGVFLGEYSLDKAVKYTNFPKKLVTEYIKKYPDSRNKSLTVTSYLKGSPASKFLKPGDIIWKINNKEIGPSLSLFDLELNKCKESAHLTIYRNDKLIEIDIPIYNMENNKINEMIYFAGGLFFEMDDYWARICGAEQKSLTIANVDAGSSLSNINPFFSNAGKIRYYIKIDNIANYQVSNLNDLIKNIPDISKKEYYSIYYYNYLASQGFNGVYYFSHDYLISDIRNSLYDAKPRIFKFDNNQYIWQINELN